MTERRASASEQKAITALALDGSANILDALSELYILEETAGRWAFSQKLDLRGEEVRPNDMFDMIGGTGIGGFYAILFARLKMTIAQAIQSHRILERVFHSDAWKNKIQEACVKALNIALDEIVNVLDIGTSLDSPFAEGNPQTKCFVCVVNPAAETRCRLLRNYRSRTDQGPLCTIRQVLHATLSNQVQLPAVRIQEEFFLPALKRHANPTHVLVRELGNSYSKGTKVACLANIGADYLCIQTLTNQKSLEELVGLLRSCQLVADDVATHCHNLGSFFFRLSAPSQLGQESHSLENDVSQVKGMTMAYLSTNEISTRLDDLEAKLCERFGVVSIERLNSLAGKDGESRVAALLAKIEEHLDGTIFQDVKKWLEPIHQTSKLDANIRARSGATCRWLLENPNFVQWMKARGIFWFRGLMGTGKTVMSSFVIETLLARDDVRVAYYYFEFTNPSTLSEEALLRSLVCQLAGISPAVVRTFHQKHEKGSLQPQLSTLQNTLNELVAASTKPIFIIIDALDEFPPTQRKYLLRSLVTFSTLNCASRTHIMVTSREETDIHREFKGKIDYELEVQGDLVRQDIAAFVDRELAAEKWTRWSRDAIEMARRLLNERADGQFRMVTCQIDILQQVKTFTQLQQSLHYLPKNLSETYNYILEKIPEPLRDLAHRLLAILSFASEPISVHELSALLAVDFGDEDDPEQLPEFREENRLVDTLDIVDLGTSLVSRVHSHYEASIQLAHASVKEHLLISSGTWFSLSEGLAHSMIARSCLALLLYFQILQDESQFPSSYHYSGRKWFKHILPNGPSQLLRQQQHIYLFFPWPCLKWDYNNIYRETRSPLVSAADLALFDLVLALLNIRSWKKDNLNQALYASASSHGAYVNAFVAKASSFHQETLTSPLQAAMLARNLAIAQFLLEKGADINQWRTNSETVLQVEASRGDLKIVCFLVEKGADVNAGGEYRTALQRASSRGYLEIVRLLVEKGANVNAGRKYKTALQDAALNGYLEIVRFLIENGADVNAEGKYDTALQRATSHGDLGIVRLLVEKGADINAGGKYRTALQAAAYKWDINLVCFLIEKGADVNAGGEYRTALQEAVDRNNLEIVHFLVEKGADINAGGKYRTALQAAAYKWDINLVCFLIEKGADVNAGGEYRTALQEAVDRNNLEMICFLIEKGADVNRGKYDTALQNAIWEGNLEIVRLLVENGANVNTGGKYGTALQEAASKGNLEIVRCLVEKGADVNARGEYGTALQKAASGGDLGIVCLLVEKGADVNAGGEYNTALQGAALNGHLEIVRFLVEKGADVDGGGEYKTALQRAASKGNLEIIRFLIEKGADVNARGEYGTALQKAASGGDLGIVRLLVEKGADVNAGGKYGTALQEAASKGNLEIVRCLVEKGADVNARGEYGTALQWAASGGDLGIVRLLVEKGADVNVGGKYKTALQEAALFGHLEIARFLIEMGADVNAEGNYKTALQEAIDRHNLEMVRVLIEKGAVVNAGEKYDTALQNAIWEGNLEMTVRFLVEKGADVNAMGRNYERTLHAAASVGNLEIVRFLLEKGADINAVGGSYISTLQHAASGWNFNIFRFIEKGANVAREKHGTALQAAVSKGNLEMVRLLIEKGADVNARKYETALQAAAYRRDINMARFLIEKGAEVKSMGREDRLFLQAAVSQRDLNHT
ncbi:ankyrin repeat-containing domain protein [Flagelloscypha sp. PMI_526]|nr:ankyrin repeat-containing domain protein [Flagelloscypha sp. PMI_526]